MEGPPKNPNRIGAILGVGRDLPTTSDKVYRSVRGDVAIQDLFEHGEVRNAASAGQKEGSRWGDAVFWSKGEDGKYHMVSEGGHVIEAPHAVASERAVTKDDITAIWSKNEKGEVENKLEELRKKMGISE